MRDYLRWVLEDPKNSIELFFVLLPIVATIVGISLLIVAFMAII